MTDAEPQTGFDAQTPTISATNAHARRVSRAYDEGMTVIAHHDGETATGLYDVFSSSGSRYLVALGDLNTCDCPDVQHYDPVACKHRIRVALEVRHTAMPAPGEDVGREYFQLLADRSKRLYNRVRFAKQMDEDYGTLEVRYNALTEALAEL